MGKMTGRFDNSKPNIILVSDITDTLTMAKNFGPYKVAYELRNAGYEVLVIDHAHVFSFEEILDLLKNIISSKTLFVGFNNMFYQSMDHISDHPLYKGGKILGPFQPGAMLPHGKSKNSIVRDHIKECNPLCQIVLGGPTAEVNPINADFDFVIIGYADVSIVNLANHLSKNEALHKAYKSIYGFTVIDDSKADGFNFSESSFKFHDCDVILPGETLPLEISRGCIFKCAFCSYPLNGKKKLDFIKNSDTLLNELLYNYNKFGTTRYIFLDDTFNDSKEKVELIYSISKQLPFQLEFWAYIRLDLLVAHPETIDMLLESGCRSWNFGIESFYPKTCSAIGKGGDKKRQLEVVEYIKNKHQNKVTLNGTFIVGLPYEPIDSIMSTLELLVNQEHALDSWEIFPMSIERNNVNRPFISNIAQNPEKFGYQILDSHTTDRFLNWKNEHIDFKTANEIVNKYRIIGQEKGTRCIGGHTAFQFASLGNDLHNLLNQKMITFDWHSIEIKKQERTNQYKQTLYQICEIHV